MEALAVEHYLWDIVVKNSSHWVVNKYIVEKKKLTEK